MVKWLTRNVQRSGCSLILDTITSSVWGTEEIFETVSKVASNGATI